MCLQIITSCNTHMMALLTLCLKPELCCFLTTGCNKAMAYVSECRLPQHAAMIRFV